MRHAVRVCAWYWIKRPFFRLLGVRRPGDAIRELQYRDLRRGPRA